jgi:hypothetical protein
MCSSAIVSLKQAYILFINIYAGEVESNIARVMAKNDSQSQEHGNKDTAWEPHCLAEQEPMPDKHILWLRPYYKHDNSTNFGKIEGIHRGIVALGSRVENRSECECGEVILDVDEPLLGRCFGRRELDGDGEVDVTWFRREGGGKENSRTADHAESSTMPFILDFWVTPGVEIERCSGKPYERSSLSRG